MNTAKQRAAFVGLQKCSEENVRVNEVLINAISGRLEATSLLPDRNRKLMD